MLILKRLLIITAIVSTTSLAYHINGGEVFGENTQYNTISDIPDSKWIELSKKKIYFGHQSVGKNIVSGIKDLMRRDPKIRINIAETDNLSDFSLGVFAHGRVGRNRQPEMKINHFSNIMMNKSVENTFDFAFLKFCYVDVHHNSNVKWMFEEYKDSIKKLEKELGNTTFIHFTLPLRSSVPPIDSKYKKRWKNKRFREPEDNVRRNEFNQMLINEYFGREPIFDIAEIESTYPDGTRCSFTFRGKKYYAMVPSYTYDGGHLNVIGRKIVAEKLLIFLSNF